VLAGQGLDTPREPGDHFCPHSWRCENPDRYPGYCTCVSDMIDAILERFDVTPKPEFDPEEFGGVGILNDPALDPVADDLAQALFHTLHNAGVSFDSATLIPRLVAAVRPLTPAGASIAGPTTTATAPAGAQGEDGDWE
jgi:hypothetical protein